MSASVAPASPPPIAQSRSSQPRPRGGLPGGAYATAAVISLLLAALSLLYPSAPAYDPWAWIIWGREIAHLQLHTFGGPTWKPLPVVFTTMFAPFGSGSPLLWLLVARTAGIMAIACASLLASRLAAPDKGRAMLAAVLAGAGVLALAQYFDSVAGGESEGLLLACVLLAILRHLDGHPRQALAFAFAAALIRPETWPFLGVYCVWLWRIDAPARAAIVALLALVPALWFVPELIGSGSLTRGVHWAQFSKVGSPARSRCPFCAELAGHAQPLLASPFKLGLVLALGAGGLAGVRARRPLLLVIALGIAWIVEEAVFTQAGFSGSDRYLLAPVALLVLAGAAGWSWTSRPAVLLAALSATLMLALLAPSFGPHFARAAAQLRYQSRLAADMRTAVRRAGGAARVLACGPVQTNPSEAPLTAWTLGAQMRASEGADGRVLIRARNGPRAAALPVLPARGGYRLLARTATVSIFSRCR